MATSRAHPDFAPLVEGVCMDPEPLARPLAQELRSLTNPKQWLMALHLCCNYLAAKNIDKVHSPGAHPCSLTQPSCQVCRSLLDSPRRMASMVQTLTACIAAASKEWRHSCCCLGWSSCLLKPLTDSIAWCQV